ncbi:MAG: helix-turn-helix transcriptional regulator [Clostridia bacterium]|nr:helix-turn-helix transcriptional regulator [Clostridia bacterium]
MAENKKALKDTGICDERKVHSEIVSSVCADMPDIDVLYDLAELYRIFADSTRIRILYVLFEKEVCVCDIADILKMTVSAVSHQLRVLRAAHLVRFRREGKTCYYSLADDHVKTIIGQGIEHITEG